MTDLARPDPYSAPTRVRVDAVPLAVIRHEGVTLDDVEDLFDADYSQLNAAAAAGRVEFAGPALAVFHGDPAGRFDVEIGMPVATGVDAIDGIVESVLPDGTAVVLTHTGAYGGLGACWSALARDADGEPTGDWAEVYVTEPGLVADERLRTDCLLYVKD